MKKILYWPGMGQSIDILKKFKEELSKGNNLDIIDFKYDVNELIPNHWNILKKQYDWWVGISLGASLLYYSYNFVEIDKRPERLIIINPFSSREVLSKEKGFDLSKQWNFSPKEQRIDVGEIDLVTSIYDDKIPSYHGVELLNNAKSKNKKIIFVKSGHAIEDEDAQIELANLLLNKERKNERFNYCNLYKQ